MLNFQFLNKEKNINFSRFTCGCFTKNAIYCMSESVSTGGDTYD